MLLVLSAIHWLLRRSRDDRGMASPVASRAARVAAVAVGTNVLDLVQPRLRHRVHPGGLQMAVSRRRRAPGFLGEAIGPMQVRTCVHDPVRAATVGLPDRLSRRGTPDPALVAAVVPSWRRLAAAHPDSVAGRGVGIPLLLQSWLMGYRDMDVYTALQIPNWWWTMAETIDPWDRQRGPDCRPRRAGGGT